MKKLLLLPLVALSHWATAQNLPVMKRIEGGTRTMGGGYQYAIKDYYMQFLGSSDHWKEINDPLPAIGEVPGENNIDLRVTVATFFLSETEVTTRQYRDFLIGKLLTPDEAMLLKAKLKEAEKGEFDSYRAAYQPLVEKAGAAGLLPDTSCWMTDFTFAYNEPLVKHYLWHKAFDGYPVMGVTWDQAHAYCEWLTETVNAQRTAKGLDPLPAYRLPTEMEWEYAARGPVRYSESKVGSEYELNSLYSWDGSRVLDDKGRFMGNIKTDHGDYIGDGYEYTAPARSFSPNGFGLYNMSGNAAEWCEDVFIFRDRNTVDDLNPLRRGSNAAPDLLPVHDDSEVEAPLQRVAKGGSWAEYHYAAMAGSRMGWDPHKGSSRIGFRVAMIRASCPCDSDKACKHDPR